VDRQIERLTEAYLASVLGLDEYKRRRADLEQRRGTLLAQEQQLETQATQHRALTDMISSVEEFCARVAHGLQEATLAQRRQLVALLIDRVIVGPDEIELRYVLPVSAKVEHIPFWQLRSNYAHRVAPLRQCGGQGDPGRAGRFQHHQRLAGRHAARAELRVQGRVPRG
jgi:site-specific DNA recombinase